MYLQVDEECNSWSLIKYLSATYGTKCTHSRLRNVIFKRAPREAGIGCHGTIEIRHRIGGGNYRTAEATLLSPRQAHLLACMVEPECTLDLYDRLTVIEEREGYVCTEAELLFNCIIDQGS